MEKDTRDSLLSAVQAARTLLEEEFAEQLEGTFDVHPNGRVADEAGEHLTPAEGLVRQKIVAAIAHKGSLGMSDKEAVADYLRDCAFTFLNRIAALKLMEGRGIVQQCVSEGTTSSGFKEFCGLAPGLTELPDKGYRLYLECLFDEIGTEVGVLFDRQDPASLLWPRHNAFLDLLTKFNSAAIRPVWAPDEDETIGWIYQYFNSQTERDKLRKKTTPSNGRELAIRNQFFTPRYVVQYLVDNTLGRIWYEMRQGQTTFADSCEYLISRPEETFLAPGVESDVEHSVSHRPLKDPREIRLIDPACGSMHFGLYAFDLYLEIYAEAWDMAVGEEDAPDGADESWAGFVGFCQDFPDPGAFLKEVPRLILAHNIHGIDIDPRAAQIAQLALWLRTQRAWAEQGIARADRPRVLSSNVVCAEPLPRDSGLLAGLTADLSSPEIGALVEQVIIEMKLAGEAGSLLKIEERITTLVTEAKKRWHEGPKHEQQMLFDDGGKTAKAPEQPDFPLDFSGITDTDFWDRAEGEIYVAIRRYAAAATEVGQLGQRLFAHDIERGFALIDLLQKTYEVAVMNPPFGAFTSDFKARAAEDYPHTSNDILAAFVERFLDKLNGGGRLGAITSRTGFFITSYQEWREEILLKRCAITSLVDLGEGVMDEATVEAAAYCLEKGDPRGEVTIIRALGADDRQAILAASVDALQSGSAPTDATYMRSQAAFKSEAESPFVYWADSAETLLSAQEHFDPIAAEVRVGLQTGDDPRFVRGRWELQGTDELFVYHPSDGSGCCSFEDPVVQAFLKRRDRQRQTWVPHVKSGASQPWFSPITVMIDWEHSGYELRNFFGTNGKLKSRPQNIGYYFRPGFSWTRRAVRFVPYTVPCGCISTVSRYMAFPHQGNEYRALAVAASNLATAYMRFFGEKFQWPNFLVENLKSLPWREPSEEWFTRAEALIKEEVAKRRAAYQTQEPFREFALPAYLSGTDVAGALAYAPESLLGREMEVELAAAYGLSEEELDDLEQDTLEAIAANRGGSSDDGEEDGAKEDKDFLIDSSEAGQFRALLSYLVGCAFGRWDVRMGKAPALAPALGDVFDPLPVCEPAALVDPVGLPAASGTIVSEDWLRARPSAITLPPEGSVEQETIADSDYPLDIPWDGILVEDRGDDMPDIVARVEAALAYIQGDHQAAATLEAAATALKIGRSKDFSLRDYFQNPKGFFEDHRGTYTKSKRKAPLYWSLATSSGSYTVWLYYHRCTGDTLPLVLRTVSDKLTATENLLHSLGPDEGKEASETEDLARELRVLKEEVKRVAPLWKPNFDDGVLINYAPLWRLVPHHKVWQKECKKTWDDLVAGKTEWAHLAMRLWPERVVPLCHQDRSLAIAHGLEEHLWFQDADDKWQARELAEGALDELIAERSSPAVQSARDSLLEAPIPAGRKRARKS